MCLRKQFLAVWFQHKTATQKLHTVKTDVFDQSINKLEKLWQAIMRLPRRPITHRQADRQHDSNAYYVFRP